MENQELITQTNQGQLSTNYTTNQILIAKKISDDIFFLGYKGDDEEILRMSKRIEHIFEPFDISILESVMEDIIIGKIKVSYEINISHICQGLSEKGVLTKKEKQRRSDSEKLANDFYSFQNEIEK